MNVRSNRFSAPTVTARPIYFDNHATTPVDPRVVAVMVRAMTEVFGNPNNRTHYFGEEAAQLIEDARQEISSLVNANPESIILLRSVTVAVQAVLSHLVWLKGDAGPLKVVSTPVEHPAVMDALAAHERDGRLSVRWLPLDGMARICIDDVIRELERGCDVICVQAANNEVGTIYPIEEIAHLASTYGAITLVDATQAAGHILLDVNRWGITFLLTAAHKMYGPKGMAAVVANVRDRERLQALEDAEGTPNVPAIAGFAEACRIRKQDMFEDEMRICALRDRLEELLTKMIEGVVVNGDRANRLAGNLHVSILGVPNEAIVARLAHSVALSTGSACRSGTDQPSHVLRAMGMTDEQIDGALRIGLGRETTPEDIEMAAELIALAVQAVRRELRVGAQ